MEIMWRFLDRRAVSYAATSLGSSMMNAVFTFYYVKIYLNLFHVSESWFHASQVVFMIWNAVNDPLFGYIQDNYSFSWVKTRRHSILYGAPFYSIAFMILWIPWGPYTENKEGSWLVGIQLMLALCFYDTLFTFVLLAECALSNEISQNHVDRIRLIRYSKVGSLIGSTSVFFTNLISSNTENFFLFQVVCAVLAVMGSVCMSYTGKYAVTQYEEKHMKNNGDTAESSLDKTSPFTMKEQYLQLFRERNLICFVLMNLCHCYHRTFLSNFISITLDALVPKSMVSTTGRSVFYGIMMIMPQILIIFGSGIIARVGYYKLLSYSFGLKIMMGLFLFLMGPQPAALMLYFLVDSVGASASFGLFGLSVSDVIDADKAKYNRRHPLSSMVFGLNALVTKPAISIAPMVSVAILNAHGYSEYKSALNGPEPAIASSELTAAMFYMACLTPVITGILQLAIWSLYTVRKSHIIRSESPET